MNAPTPAKADETTDLRSDEAFVLIKRGLFWRPNAMGYTGVLSEAGLYTEKEALGHAGYDGVTHMPVAEATRFSPACWAETKIKVLDTQIATLSAAHAAEIQARRAERDSFRDQLATVCGKLFVAEARADRLAAENAVLVKALKTFAAAADAFPISPVVRREDRRRHELVWSYGTEDAGNRREISVADLRAARAALPEAITPKETSDGE